ncbi:MAG: YbaN family protein [Chitinispirillaceae bacterium]|nr:YbaN family protein [Chitinispirillaceae bacterium]
MFTRIRNGVLFFAGSICLALGLIGIFLPLLPTTPLLLLAAACYFRSSERLYRWLIHHRLFGLTIRGFRHFHAVSLRAKTVSVVLLWVCITLSVLFAVRLLWARILLIAIAVAVSGYILGLRTLTKEMIEEIEE